jgi:signal transduction histidine kinase
MTHGADLHSGEDPDVVVREVDLRAEPASFSRAAELHPEVAAISRIPAIPVILETVCRMTGMGFAAVARVTEDRWVACAVRDDVGFGIEPGGELEIATTFCNEIRKHGHTIVIDHVAEDTQFAEHPIPKMYGFQSYLSTPIKRPDGTFFGTLCVVDPRPAKLSDPHTVGMFKLFAELIGLHLDAYDRLAASTETALHARHAAELRDQFIAVLGHDLKNPLASIDAGMRLIRRTELDPRAQEVATLIESSVERMAGLIEDVLDFARGRLGAGVNITRRRAPVQPVLDQVIAELRAAYPMRVIETDFLVDRPVEYDPGHMSRLVSNLVANALVHGAEDAPVKVRAETRPELFELSVANAGEPIEATVMARLFQPFERGAARPGREGLGLGLYIASEVARAHGGAIEAMSTPEETTFTFRMPLI